MARWQVGNILSEQDYSFSCLVADAQRHRVFMLACLHSREALDLLQKTGNDIFAAGDKLWWHSEKPVGQRLHDFIYEMSYNHPQVARLAIRARVLPNLAEPDPNMECGCWNCDLVVRQLDEYQNHVYLLVSKLTQQQEIIIADSRQEACAKLGWRITDTYIQEIR